MASSKRERNSFEYDVALSFAGEDRNVAKKLFRLLTRQGHRVFYDEDRRAHLWGRDSAEFERIYSTASRYVIPLISADYKQKPWTQWEFATARREAERRTGPFLLPVRLDDSRLFGLKEDTGYLDIRSLSIKEIASDFDAKMKATVYTIARPRQAEARSAARLLAAPRRHALGLIATSGIPLHLATYEKIFPDVDWRRETRALKRMGLLKISNRRLDASATAQRIFRGDDAESGDLHHAWLKALTPYEQHIDIPILRGFHHLALWQLDDMVVTLAEGVESTDTGWWTTLYITMLDRLTDKTVLPRISKPSRVKLYNALGLCFAQQDNQPKAIEWFKKLRKYAKRVSHNWGLGQSYINQGVAEHSRGNDKLAARLYRSAVAHARNTGDDLLLGRSLTNLAQLLMDDCPDEAESLLTEGLRAKRKVNDRWGMVSSRLAIGNLHAARQQHTDAAKCFKQAAETAARLGSFYQRALAIHNYACSMFDMKRLREARDQYRRAQSIAERHGYDDVLQLTEGGLSRTYHALKQYRRAGKCFGKLYVLKSAAGDDMGAAVALHDVGACQMASRDYASAGESLRHALRRARGLHSQEWIAQCLIDLTVARHGGKLTDSAIKELRSRAHRERRREALAVAAHLWELIAAAQMDSAAVRADVTNVTDSLSHWRSCLENSKCDLRVKMVEAWKVTYIWRWQNRDYDGGIEALERMEKMAARVGAGIDRIHAIDQRGCCYQDRRKYSAAVTMHQKALQLAKDASLDSEVVGSLNNLGEAFRATGRYSEAIEVFLQAESMSRRLRDHASELMSQHNRALALMGKGEEPNAKRLLVKCRNTAKKHGVWYEHARAWEGLANLSACQEKCGLAETRYRRAIDEAKKHGHREMLPRIALNLARLLRNQDRQRQALSILRPHENTFADYSDAHLYHMTLAELYQDLGNLENAADSWRKAQNIVESTGTADDIALCAGALGEIYEELNKPRLSDRQLLVALKNEHDPELRGCLLVQRLGVLLAMEKDKQAEDVIAEAEQLASTHGLSDVHIDIHMMYGDYAWSKDKKHKREAMKAYMVALAKALEESLDEGMEGGLPRFGELAGHILSELVLGRRGLNAADFEVLCQKTESWLLKQIGSEEGTRLLMWPIRAALIALPYAKKPAKLQQVLQDYVQEIVSPGRGHELK